MKALDKLKSRLKPGRLYRRSDLLAWSNAVDRHIKRLLEEKVLKKLSNGLYYCPKKGTFGEVPPSDKDLITSFLRDDRFLIFSRNDYNTLGVGTTQLYNETIVYNHKRHGVFKLGNRNYKFVRKHYFPKELSKEFLLIDLVNHEKTLVDEREKVLSLVEKVVKTLNQDKIYKLLKNLSWKHAEKLLTPLIEAKYVC